MSGTTPILIVYQNGILFILLPFTQQRFGTGYSCFIITFLITTTSCRIQDIKIILLFKNTYPFYQPFLPRSVITEQRSHFSYQTGAVLRHLLCPNICRQAHTVAVFFPYKIKFTLLISCSKSINRAWFLSNQRSQIFEPPHRGISYRRRTR